MPRQPSTIVEPHRDLFLDERDPQVGADIRALTAAADRRLDARNVRRDFAHHARLDVPEDFAALITAARLLGAAPATLKAEDDKGRRVLTVGAQRLIRHPGWRTPAQLGRADRQLAALIDAREKRAKEQAQADDGSVSGLSAAQRADARRRAVAAMQLLLAHPTQVHYTQGLQRWQGISTNRRSGMGQFPTYCDCSSSTTWALWDALLRASRRESFPDIVNGSGWAAGYTGTQLAHGRVVALDKLMPGDLVFYGRPGSTGSHVVMVDDDTRYVISQGSEAGPFRLLVRYRSDVMGARRYI